MGKRKTLNELTIKDNFMFAAVMSDPSNCKPLLEMILEVPIKQVEVSSEKNFIYNPQYHGVRLDVYANDAEGSYYDIEMQVKKDHVLKRSRYYHSHMDMDFLETNKDYVELPESYVIFICDFDPFGYKRFRYTQESIIKEVPDFEVKDGVHSIYLSTKGEITDDVPVELIRFLNYVHASEEDSCKDFDDPFVDQLQNAVARIKASREMGSRFMLLEEMLRDERAEGVAEGLEKGLAKGLAKGQIKQARSTLLSLLEIHGMKDDQMLEEIARIDDIQLLDELTILVAKSASTEEFLAAYKRLMS